jgi:hypothetical protein
VSCSSLVTPGLTRGPAALAAVRISGTPVQVRGDGEWLERLASIPVGYSEGVYEGRRWGVTSAVSADGRRRWLYGEELGGPGRVSFNLYRTAAGLALRPCEMSAEWVTAFVLGYVPD